MAATRTPAAEAGFAHVVILASLGGLPAISVLLSELPATFPVPVLLLQHAPNNGSPHRLASLLGKRTALPVRTAQSASSARASAVTVIPGGHTATVSPQGFLHLREAAGPAGDALLTSAATAATPDKVIAVVLSGMLHDGTEGVRATKRHGGRVLAQDPATARAPGMPSSAIATGCVDFVLSPGRIAFALIALTMAPGGAELFSVPMPHWARIGA